MSINPKEYRIYEGRFRTDQKSSTGEVYKWVTNGKRTFYTSEESCREQLNNEGKFAITVQEDTGEIVRVTPFPTREPLLKRIKNRMGR